MSRETLLMLAVRYEQAMSGALGPAVQNMRGQTDGAGPATGIARERDEPPTTGRRWLAVLVLARRVVRTEIFDW